MREEEEREWDDNRKWHDNEDFKEYQSIILGKAAIYIDPTHPEFKEVVDRRFELEQKLGLV